LWLIGLENKNVETILQTKTEEPQTFMLSIHFHNTFIFFGIFTASKNILSMIFALRN